MRALFSVLRTAGAHRGLLPAALLALAADLAGVTLLTLAAWLIARAAEQPPMGVLSVAVVAVRALAVTRGLFRYGERLAGHDAALRAVAGLRGRVFGALARRPAGEDARTVRDADAASRLVADVDLVQDALLRVALPALSAAAVSVAAVVCAALVSPRAALVLAVGLAAGGLLLPALTAAASARAARRVAALRAQLTQQAVDLMDGAADLRIFGAADRASARAAATARRLRAHDRGAALQSALAAAALTVVQGGTAVAVALVCAHSASGVWTVTLPLLALASFEPLTPLPAAAQHLTALPESARRVHALLHTPARPAADAVATDGTDGAHAAAAGTGPHLSVRNLYVRHRPDGPFAVRGVNLELPPGRRVAVVGPSGAGKSTLLAAIARFALPHRGHLLLDGEDLTRFPEAALRRTVSGALQDAHVFHTSVRHNLLPARPGATDAELHEALRRAGLLSWVLSLPRQLDTVVGSDGGRLSGGQRRRLVLARALLAAPPVLLLDEPTEGLDPASADAVLADVLTATRGTSLVLVTHRTVGLEAVDEILVMDAGRVVRRGTPRAVLTPAPDTQDTLAPAGPHPG
ncbi:thiol reductant ABC exporter subunit CydC [Streptomyces sp. NEAU-W12]|uniref:thiol reductant ABC exporter subunit CydC n=1 Tax=Streptomyces sp. NEAU-W12 TaxID=2994668 RepID=UPI00224B3098|nr:thiol reductant ABC exporter subunit CydC [Streptomyces sp. NEAU-W12]MCX2923055.1 thiol reductant ABC exporter subunit CydC [Streptomyces sp. NEAU-W12]